MFDVRKTTSALPSLDLEQKQKARATEALHHSLALLWRPPDEKLIASAYGNADNAELVARAEAKFMETSTQRHAAQIDRFLSRPNTPFTERLRRDLMQRSMGMGMGLGGAVATGHEDTGSMGSGMDEADVHLSTTARILREQPAQLGAARIIETARKQHDIHVRIGALESRMRKTRSLHGLPATHPAFSPPSLSSATAGRGGLDAGARGKGEGEEGPEGQGQGLAHAEGVSEGKSSMLRRKEANSRRMAFRDYVVDLDVGSAQGSSSGGRGRDNGLGYAGGGGFEDDEGEGEGDGDDGLGYYHGGDRGRTSSGSSSRSDARMQGGEARWGDQSDRGRYHGDGFGFGVNGSSSSSSSSRSPSRGRGGIAGPADAEGGEGYDGHNEGGGGEHRGHWHGSQQQHQHQHAHECNSARPQDWDRPWRAPSAQGRTKYHYQVKPGRAYDGFGDFTYFSHSFRDRRVEKELGPGRVSTSHTADPRRAFRRPGELDKAATALIVAENEARQYRLHPFLWKNQRVVAPADPYVSSSHKELDILPVPGDKERREGSLAAGRMSVPARGDDGLRVDRPWTAWTTPVVKAREVHQRQQAGAGGEPAAGTRLPLLSPMRQGAGAGAGGGGEKASSSRPTTTSAGATGEASPSLVERMRSTVGGSKPSASTHSNTRATDTSHASQAAFVEKLRTFRGKSVAQTLPPGYGAVPNGGTAFTINVSEFARTGVDPLAIASSERDPALTASLRLNHGAVRVAGHLYADPVRDIEFQQSPFRDGKAWEKRMAQYAGRYSPGKGMGREAGAAAAAAEEAAQVLAHGRPASPPAIGTLADSLLKADVGQVLASALHPSGKFEYAHTHGGWGFKKVV
jgi:hypothetical protein